MNFLPNEESAFVKNKIPVTHIIIINAIETNNFIRIFMKIGNMKKVDITIAMQPVRELDFATQKKHIMNKHNAVNLTIFLFSRMKNNNAGADIVTLIA